MRLYVYRDINVWDNEIEFQLLRRAYVSLSRYKLAGRKANNS